MVKPNFSRLLHGSWALLIFVLLMLQPAIYQGIIKARGERLPSNFTYHKKQI